MIRDHRIHMLGIGGAGMSGIARILAAQGKQVSGSDLILNDTCRKLAAEGIEIAAEHSADHIKADIELVVISTAVPDDNEELLEAHKRGIPVIRRGEMLARLVEDSRCIAVAGAHGKTTISSMIYAALEHCDCRPSFAVGAEMQSNGLNAGLGQGEVFVIEADESDASFLALNPYIAVASNIENDHLDFYHSLDNIKDAFVQFLNQKQQGGLALLCGDDPGIRNIRHRADWLPERDTDRMVRQKH